MNEPDFTRQIDRVRLFVPTSSGRLPLVLSGPAAAALGLKTGDFVHGCEVFVGGPRESGPIITRHPTYEEVCAALKTVASLSERYELLVLKQLLRPDRCACGNLANIEVNDVWFCADCRAAMETA